MTHEDMAEALGVARRTIATWHERPDVVLRAEIQRALDTAYGRATEAQKAVFVRQLTPDADEITAAEAGATAFAVAIAIVVAENDVLIVCRRDEGPSGITWQFPAGVIKPGATPSTVAVRETLAETGVHCAVRHTLGSRIHPLSKVYCQYFLCEYLAGTVENRDTSENVSAIFVPRQDLTRFIPADRIYQPVLHALEALGDRTSP
jgi:8-oxo-dGTP pyrophosphatase MutT (NUDIX family)